MATLIEVLCENQSCLKKFHKPLSQHNKVKKHYCSTACCGESSKSKGFIDQTFYDLTCMKEVPKPNQKSRGSYFLFRCICGEERVANGCDVKAGRVQCCKKCKIRKTTGKNSVFWDGVGDIAKGWWYKHVIKTAENREIEVKITMNYAWNLFLKQKRRCKFTNIILKFPEVGDGIATASLDRIDSNKGYVVGNIQWVHKHINIMKGTKTDDDFIELCKLVANNC